MEYCESVFNLENYLPNIEDDVSLIFIKLIFLSLQESYGATNLIFKSNLVLIEYSLPAFDYLLLLYGS